YSGRRPASRLRCRQRAGRPPGPGTAGSHPRCCVRWACCGLLPGEEIESSFSLSLAPKGAARACTEDRSTTGAVHTHPNPTPARPLSSNTEAPIVCDMDPLVPPPRVGTPAATLCVAHPPGPDAERPDVRSHAERGNEGLHQHVLQMGFRHVGDLLVQGTPVRVHRHHRREVLDVHLPDRLWAAELLQIDVRHALDALRVNLRRPADGVQVDAAVLLTRL